VLENYTVVAKCAGLDVGIWGGERAAVVSQWAFVPGCKNGWVRCDSTGVGLHIPTRFSYGQQNYSQLNSFQ
jgi:hypothetical protein